MGIPVMWCYTIITFTVSPPSWLAKTEGARCSTSWWSPSCWQPDSYYCKQWSVPLFGANWVMSSWDGSGSRNTVSMSSQGCSVGSLNLERACQEKVRQEQWDQMQEDVHQEEAESQECECQEGVAMWGRDTRKAGTTYWGTNVMLSVRTLVKSTDIGS
jgi:hypothetical protein